MVSVVILDRGTSEHALTCAKRFFPFFFLFSNIFATFRPFLKALPLMSLLVQMVQSDCWPDAALCRWLTRPPFLNAGVFAGTAGNILAMLETMRSE